jgi:deoxyribonuclease-4
MMLPDGRRLGAHLPLGAGMVKAVERAHAIGANALQVFADNPTAWRRRTNPPKEAAAFRHRLAELDIAPVAIHAAYLVNLAGPDADFFASSVAVLANELRVAPDFAARFVNVHVGSHRGTGLEAGTARVAEGLRLVFAEVDAATVDPRVDSPVGAPEPAVLVLENSAGGGFGIGATVEELAAIAEAAASVGVGPDRLGFCLDTAHAWGAGYPISEPDEVDALVAAFDVRIGIDRLRMIHLNDSKAALGQNADRHEHLGAGSIGPRGLARVLTHPALAHVAYYIETPGMDEGYDAINLARALAMARGEPLPQLPPEATLVRGSRSRTAPAEPESDEG